MSHYASVEVQYSDKDMLVQALIKAGFRREQIEVYDTPQKLLDYTGRPTQTTTDPRFDDGDKAHIIIRREHVGKSCNDYGIYIDPVHGSREFVCSWARTNAFCCVVNPTVAADGGFGRWSGRLKREYAVAVGEQQFHEQGLVTERVDDPDGNIYVYAQC